MQVSITIRTVPAQFAGGTVGGDWRIEVAPAADGSAEQPQDYEGVTPSHNFDLTRDQTYNARGFRLDAAGDPLGPIATLQFTAGADVIMLDVASAVEAGTPVVNPLRDKTQPQPQPKK